MGAMSESADRIGGWISLALFAILLIVGGWPHDTVAQVQQVQQPPQTPVSAGWWPGDAPIFGAIIAGVAAWAIANFYTKRLKRIEATLEFSKRFHELIQQQRSLNRRYEHERVKPGYDSKADQDDADAWWWQVFDLLLYEYDFYQSRLVGMGRFEEWMVWRWHDFHPEPGKEWTTCGVNYTEAWARWKQHPAHGSRLITLVDEIHRIPDTRTPDMTEEQKREHGRLIATEVRKKIKPHGPPWWGRTDLDGGRL